MYQKIKACLIAPKRIVDYMKEKASHTFWFAFALIILYVLPMIITFFVNNNASTAINTTLAEKTAEASITYKIEDGKLIDTSGNNNVQYVEGLSDISTLTIDTVVVFNLNEQLPDLPTENTGYYLIIEFNEQKLNIYLAFASKEAKNPNADKMSNVIDAKTCIFTENYSKLKLSTADFSQDKNSLVYLYNEITNNIYRVFKLRWAPILIISIILGGAISFLFQVLVVAALESLLYRYMNLRFKLFFKTIILCSLPMVLLSMIAEFTGVSFIGIIGDIILIIYSIIALSNYKLKYGIPNRGFFGTNQYQQPYNNETVDNESSAEEADEEEEKGDDEDEL